MTRVIAAAVFLASMCVPFVASCVRKPSAVQPGTQPPTPASDQATGGQIPGLPAVQTLGSLSETEKKMDAALILISRAHTKGGDEAAREAAKRQVVTIERDRARIEVTCASAAVVGEVGAVIKKQGGQVVTTVDNKAFAWIPFASVAPLAADARVWSIAASVPTFKPAAPGVK